MAGRSLHFTATAIKLAEALWNARSEAFGVVQRDWKMLLPREKHDCVEQAEKALEAVRPVPTYRASTDYFASFVDTTRRYGQKVVGAIEPGEPAA